MRMYCYKCKAIKQVKRGFKVRYIGQNGNIRQVKAPCPECGHGMTSQRRV